MSDKYDPHVPCSHGYHIRKHAVAAERDGGMDGEMGDGDGD